jgi:hypothetical protein
MYQAPFPGKGSPVAALWLLAGGSDARIPTKMFLCKSDLFVTRPARLQGSNLLYFSNFQEAGQLSYSIATPWVGTNTAPWWRLKYDTQIPLICDMAPLSGDSNVNTTAPQGGFRPNSPNHEWRGQNVAYGDAHVEWSPTPRCGPQDDNIFAVGGATNPVQLPLTNMGVLPNGGPGTSGPPFDSLMVPVRRGSDGVIEGFTQP